MHPVWGAKTFKISSFQAWVESLYESLVQFRCHAGPESAFCLPAPLALLQGPQAEIGRTAEGRVYGLRLSDLGQRDVQRVEKSHVRAPGRAT
jgi:hypothetical protein